MPRKLTILFQRDPARDRQQGEILFTGYQISWPDGRPVTVGLDAFCRRGLRLLGLDRYLAGYHERLIEILCFPLKSMDEDMTRLPAHRVRRFFLERKGKRGRLHFMDGTATDTFFELGRDDTRILDWIGFFALKEGERQWLDLAAHPVADGSPEGIT
jgi:hypothetical protein